MSWSPSEKAAVVASQLSQVDEMSVSDLRKLPYREKWDKPINCSSIVLLPTRRNHDSGYRIIEVIAVDEIGHAMCKVTTCSDVVHLEGIGGWGKRDGGRLPGLVKPAGWSIDLMANGLFRLWPNSRSIEITAALSSLEVYSVERKKTP